MIRGRFITISYQLKKQFNLEFSECALLGHLTNLTSFGHSWYETSEYMPSGKRSKGRFLFQLAQLVDEGFTVGGVSKLLKRLTAKQLIEIRADGLAVNVTKTYLEAWAAVNRYDDGVPLKKSRAKEQPKEKEKDYFERHFTKAEFCEIIISQNKDADVDFYAHQITEHYRGDKMTKEQAKGKIESWLKRERKIVKEGGGAAQVEELTKEFFRYKELIAYPHEHTTFTRFKDDVKTFIEFGAQLEKAGSKEHINDFYNKTKEMIAKPGATREAFEKRMLKYKKAVNKSSDKNLEQLAANLKQ